MALRGQFKAGAKPDSVRQRKYNSQTDQKKRRAQRNNVRRAAIRMKGKKALQGKEIDHPNSPKNGPLNNSKTRIISKSLNRKLGGEKSHTGNSRK